MTTKIEWTDETWNPIVGCSKISEGCENCYAETAAASGRLQKFEQYQQVINFEIEKSYGRTVGCQWNGKTVFVDSALEKPLHWKKPRKIFVCSMGDLFHESVPFAWIDKVMAVIALSPHTFQVLTKRPKKMLRYFSRKNLAEKIHDAACSMGIYEAADNIYEGVVSYAIFNPTYKNLWLGVTAENQKCADERIHHLFHTYAAKRFVSLEPLLGEVDLKNIIASLTFEAWGSCPEEVRPVRLNVLYGYQIESPMDDEEGNPIYYQAPTGSIPKLDWAIVGCESGPKRRECKIEWVRDIVEQCQEAKVPVFVKQLSINGTVSKDMDEWPEDLRVREFPKESESE